MTHMWGRKRHAHMIRYWRARLGPKHRLASKVSTAPHWAHESFSRSLILIRRQERRSVLVQSHGKCVLVPQYSMVPVPATVGVEQSRPPAGVKCRDWSAGGRAFARPSGKP
jgi:hypothetical protein